MCTVVILRRPDHSWPLLLAANRDEMADRPWEPPARHWPDRADTVGGRDRMAGGTWLAVNDYGVAAAVLNRRGTLGPERGYRSRGELPLEAADHADAAQAVEALADLDPCAYRPFNMVVADNRDAFWLRNDGREVEVFPIPPGLSMLTAFELNDRASPRIAAYLDRFLAAPAPEPDAGDWSAWQVLLSDRAPAVGADLEAESGPAAAMCVHSNTGFGTVSSSLLALPSAAAFGVRPVWLFAPGRPDRVPYAPLGFDSLSLYP